ncbi:MAG: iron donor protein CyaY [Betaproteobacteria bacterium]|nr:iron donor protein CyaY [Betaproteobacteria bacterium]
MTESEFNQLSEQTFQQLESLLEHTEGDIDFEMAGGNVLEIDCSGSKIIINRQAAMHEMWVAARSGGFHYRWQEGAWRNTRDGSELISSLAGMILAQCGAHLPLSLT